MLLEKGRVKMIGEPKEVINVYKKSNDQKWIPTVEKIFWYYNNF